MSDIGVSYNINYSPNPVNANVRISLSGTEVNAVISGVPVLAVTATPNYSANIISDIASTVGTPMVNAITLFLGTVLGNFVNGRSISITSVPSIPLNIEGAQINLQPSNLGASNFNGMLKISGDFSLS